MDQPRLAEYKKMKKIFSAFAILSVLLTPSPGYTALHTRESMAEFLGIENWRGTPPTRDSLTGYTTILAFIRPSDPRTWLKFKILTEWHKKYFADGVRVVALITPEYEFEKDLVAFKQKFRKLKLLFPVGEDREGLTFRAYNPPEGVWVYFIGKRGRIRYAPPESETFPEQEQKLRFILKEVEPELAEAIEKYPQLRLPQLEIVTLGYKQILRLGNPVQQVLAEIPKTFKVPDEKKEGYFYLSGKWKFAEDYATNVNGGESLEFYWNGQPLSLLAGVDRETPVPLEITVDGQPVGDKKLRGRDLIRQAGKTYVLVRFDSLYDVLNTLNQGPHLLRVTAPNPGVKFYKIILSKE